jgi:hypothetical protein
MYSLFTFIAIMSLRYISYHLEIWNNVCLAPLGCRFRRISQTNSKRKQNKLVVRLLLSHDHHCF